MLSTRESFVNNCTKCKTLEFATWRVLLTYPLVLPCYQFTLIVPPLPVCSKVQVVAPLMLLVDFATSFPVPLWAYIFLRWYSLYVQTTTSAIAQEYMNLTSAALSAKKNPSAIWSKWKMWNLICNVDYNMSTCKEKQEREISFTSNELGSILAWKFS